MKKVSVILAVIAIGITMFSCGGGESKSKKDNSAQKAGTQKELIISLTIGDQNISLKDAKVRNNAMTPAQKSDDYTIYADLEGAPEDIHDVAFSLDFTTTGSGEVTDSDMSFENYDINNVSIKIEKFETKKGTYGGIGVTSIKGTFYGQLKKTDEDGFPIGELIDFKGDFEK